MLRGDLRISVLTNGNLKATRKQEIKCKVRRRTTIIELIDEGVVLTAEDVKNKRVLVKLDTAELDERQKEAELQVASAEAAFIETEAAYRIQQNQNISDIRQSHLKVKFAWMDVEKYLGTRVSRLLASADAEKVDFVVFAAGDDSGGEPKKAEATGQSGGVPPPSEEAGPAADGQRVDFGELARSKDLGGAAHKERIKLESDIDLAVEERQRAADKVEWTRKLVERKFLSRTELEADALSLKRQEAELQQAEIAMDLFGRYEFAKQAEQLYSDWEEARSERERVEAKAKSELSQKKANRDSKQAALSHEKRHLKEYNEQLVACTIVAERPGMVVYASSRDWRGNQRDIIAEGEEVRERQTILTVPDTSAMGVEVKVHESVVKRVKPGQRAILKVDALPGLELEGEVKKVAILPDPTNWWLNPDLKEYSTEVVVLGSHPNLKPGMTVQVEIVMDELKDVLQVPVQAVHADEDRTVCHVKTPDGPVPRVVKLGATDDRFVEILDGLTEGQEVYLKAPVSQEASSPGAEATKQSTSRPAKAESGPAKAQSGPASRAHNPAGASRPAKKPSP